MCKRNFPDKNEGKTQKMKANMGCVRETHPIKVKPAWDV